MNSSLAYIGLGSNLNNPLQQVRSAIQQLADEPAVNLHAVSRFYTSQPMGPQDQPDYVNAVIALNTSLAAPDLLQILFKIEWQHGRERHQQIRWGARTLDLDLLLYGDTQLHTPDLQIPHPGICQRAFVLLPLLDIAPTLSLPNGQGLTHCLQDLSQQDDVGWVYPLQ
jgi:2-amino-4-hydroxy-6-hydroxymethyldihydropteridine diphosphokinase